MEAQSLLSEASDRRGEYGPNVRTFASRWGNFKQPSLTGDGGDSINSSYSESVILLAVQLFGGSHCSLGLIFTKMIVLQ